MKNYQQDPAGAIPHFRQAAKIQPNYTTAHANWAAALADSGDLQGALDKYRQTLSLIPPNHPFRAAINESIQEVQAKQAEEPEPASGPESNQETERH